MQVCGVPLLHAMEDLSDEPGEKTGSISHDRRLTANGQATVGSVQ